MNALIDTSRSVAELLLENPGRARAFEAHRIDYCCGGKSSLAEACARRGAPIEAVVDSLSEADADREGALLGTDWSVRSCKDLIEHIIIFHHAYLRGELPRLAALAAKVAKVHGDKEPALAEVSRLFSEMRGELESHMMKEEQVLFPFVEQLEGGKDSPFPTIGLPISCMEHEHSDVGDALERLRSLTNNFTAPEGACGSWRVLLDGLRELEADLHAHIHKENNILFPRALAMEVAMRDSAPSTRFCG